MLRRRLFLLPALLLSVLAAAPASACEPPPGVAENRVVPVVRSRAFVEGVRELNGQVLPVRLLNSELAVVFAEKTLSQLRYFRVPPDQAACWTEAGALRDSLRNLSRDIQAVSAVEARPGVMLIGIGGKLESSLILAHRVLRQAVDNRLDTMLVGVPDRDMLLIADPQDAQAVQRLRQAVEESFAKGTQPISSKLFQVSACEISVVVGEAPQAPQPCR
jgi:uncharacterized protein YtpQ (UPF0354 family)